MTQPSPATDQLIAAARQAIEAGRPAEARPLLERAGIVPVIAPRITPAG